MGKWRAPLRGGVGRWGRGKLLGEEEEREEGRDTGFGPVVGMLLLEEVEGEEREGRRRCSD